MTSVSKGKLRLRSELCDVHSLTGLAIQIVHDTARAKNIQIECELNSRHSRLLGDPPRLQQVLWNLLRNAVKFTPSGGKIRARTSDRTDEDGRIWLLIEISDSGIGIEPAALERIFLPFAQEEAASSHPLGGIGLGLTIARAIVEMHGGKIHALSDGSNRGATFVVELPANIAKGRVESAHSRATRAKNDLGGTNIGEKLPGTVRSILLVEDHAATLQTVSTTLRRWGCEVATATSVAEALATAAGRAFDLVISDLGLPDGTGLQLMEKLRTEHGLRGIALSGYGMEEDLARSRAAGFIAHLVKPIHLADLRNLLGELPGTAKS
jgi:CheY-like chemotaxis protein